MNPETLAKLGLAPEATMEEQAAALAAYMEGADADKAKLAKLEGAHAEPDGDEKPAVMEAGEKDEKDKAEMQVMSATLAATQRELAELQSERRARKAAEESARLQTFEALADEAVANGYPKEDRAALVKFASSDLAAAHKLVGRFLKTSTPREVLMGRMTAGGSPLGFNPSNPLAVSARTMDGGSDRRIVKMGALGNGARAEVTGEKLSAVVSALADSKDPVVMQRIDSMLGAMVKGSKYESYERYLAAEKIVEQDRPDLVAAARAAASNA